MSILRRLAVATLAALLGVTAWSAPAVARPGDPVPVGAWPLQPEPDVVTGFDPPDAPWGAGHRGVDLLGDPEQPVHAALAGTVTFAGMLAGRGVVVVLHGDTRTTYEPVGATVQVGGQVGRGEVVGRLQATGSHCAPQVCLHWGWLRGSTYLDPLDLVGAGPIRLLPLWRDEPLPWAGSVSSVAWSTPYAAVLLRLEAQGRVSQLRGLLRVAPRALGGVAVARRWANSGFAPAPCRASRGCDARDGRELRDTPVARSPPGYARGCACW